MNEHDILTRLNEILSILQRIEQRQIVVKGEIEEQAPPVVGSFATSQLPHEDK